MRTIRKAVDWPQFESMSSTEYDDHFAAVSERLIDCLPVAEGLGEQKRKKDKVVKEAAAPVQLTAQGVFVNRNIGWSDTLAIANQARLAGLTLFVRGKKVEHPQLDDGGNLKRPLKRVREEESDDEDDERAAKRTKVNNSDIEQEDEEMEAGSSSEEDD